MELASGGGGGGHEQRDLSYQTRCASEYVIYVCMYIWVHAGMNVWMHACL